MNRKIYESPSTLRFSVALEGNFAGSANVQNPDDAKTGRIDAHGINLDFDDSFSTDGWGTTATE